MKKLWEFGCRLILIIKVKPIIPVYKYCPCTVNEARFLENIYMAIIFLKGLMYSVVSWNTGI